MKNNTGLSKAHLQEAIKGMPDDFALSTARFHLNEALREIEKIEGKRVKRENVAPHPNIAKVPTPNVAPQKTANFVRQATPQSPMQIMDIRTIYQIIDGMIDEEKSALVALQQAKIKPEPEQENPGNADTLLG